MSTTLETINQQIASIDEEITLVQEEINNIDSSSANGLELSACVGIRRDELVLILEQYNDRKDELVERKNTIETSWDETRQAVVDSINTEFNDLYAGGLNEFLFETDERKTEFFTIYPQADTTFLKELVLKQFIRQI